MNYQYRIYPSIEQESRMDSWLEMLRSVFNYALRERKDWVNSSSALSTRVPCLVSTLWQQMRPTPTTTSSKMH